MNVQAGRKDKKRQAAADQYDFHTVLSKLLLKAEKSPDSLERMLAVSRLLLTFLTQIMKPGTRFQETPTVVLGHHYLSHRELHGDYHRGDKTRSYVQELCAYDPVEAPVTPKVYNEEGHCEVGTWQVQIVPKAHAKMKKEGIIGGTTQQYVEIELDGNGTVKYNRHDEKYTFNFPAIILSDPLSEFCPLDLDGMVTIMCEATGLKTELQFKPWKDEFVKGEVSSLHGDGMKIVARVEGNWDATVSVHSVNTDASGVLFSTADDPPPVHVPPVINLRKPGPQTIFRLWSGIIECLLYADAQSTGGATSKKLNELVASFPSYLKHSLMYEVPENPQGKSATSAGGNANDPTSQLAAALDKRPLPPICKIQRALGRHLTYQLKYVVQSLSHASLEQEALQIAECTGAKSGN